MSWIMFALHYLIADCEEIGNILVRFGKDCSTFQNVFLPDAAQASSVVPPLPTQLINLEARDMYLLQFQSLVCC